jgi:hypothetical protein
MRERAHVRCIGLTLAVMAVTAAMATAADITLEKAPDVTAKIYGKIKADAAYDDATVDAGNFARWVQSPDVDAEDQFNLTARATQLGIKLIGPTNATFEAGARTEIDFYEGGAENKNRLQLRHAYMTITHKPSGVSLLAGQTSDVISPLFPYMLNYTVAWWSGNIGYRRPQVRLSKDWALADEVTLATAICLSRTSAHSSTFDPAHAGEDSESPIGQGRVGLSFPVFGRHVAIGVSGHTGHEEIPLGEDAVERKFSTWSANVDVLVPLCSFAAVKGEWWQGENLDHFLGGIGYGVNETVGDERTVSAEGGWLAMELGPWHRCRFNVGAGVDNPDDADLTEGSRSRNLSYWGNVVYSVIDPVEVGFELSHWETDYIGKADGDATRAQMSFMYYF